MENRKLTSFLFLIFVSTLLIGCKGGESPRDKIIINGSIQALEDSIRKMNLIMEKLELESDEMKNSFIDENGDWVLNNKKLGKFDSVNLESERSFKNLSLSERQSLKILMGFLRQNNINGSYKNAPCKNCYLYDYRPTNDNSFRMQRNILLVEDNNLENLLATYELLDRKHSLALIAGK